MSPVASTIQLHQNIPAHVLHKYTIMAPLRWFELNSRRRDTRCIPSTDRFECTHFYIVHKGIRAILVSKTKRELTLLRMDDLVVIKFSGSGLIDYIQEDA